MATPAKGIKVDPGTARAVGRLLAKRAELGAVQGDGSSADNEFDAQVRGHLMGIDEALAALWAATLEGAQP